MKNYPSIRQLQYLSVLSETNHYGRAAELCNVTQPTLSSAIKELEKTIGADVIDRSRAKYIKLTSLGKFLVYKSEIIFDAFDTILQESVESQKPLSGSFRLGLIPTIAPYILPVILPKLQNKFPDMAFEITEDLSANLISNLDSNNLDLVIMAFPYDTPDLKQTIIIEEAFYCAAPMGSFQHKKILLDDLNNQNILLLQDGHCLRDHALTACKVRNKAHKNTLSATSLITLIQMVGQGYGMTLLPEMVIKAGSFPPNVEIYEFEKPSPTRKIGLAWRENTSLNKNINAVGDFLKTIIQ